jgi:hypothetical protein
MQPGHVKLKASNILEAWRHRFIKDHFPDMINARLKRHKVNGPAKSMLTKIGAYITIIWPEASIPAAATRMPSVSLHDSELLAEPVHRSEQAFIK